MVCELWGGGYAGDCFASIYSRESTSAQWASGTTVGELWHEEVEMLAFDWRRALPRSSTSARDEARGLLSPLWASPGARKGLAGDCFASSSPSLVNLGSVRSTWASVFTVRELRYEEVDMLATDLSQAHLACHPQLRTKRVGFCNYVVRPLHVGRLRHASGQGSVVEEGEWRRLPTLLMWNVGPMPAGSRLAGLRRALASRQLRLRL